MTQIARTFERLRASGRRGFIPFVTAGDPDLDSTLEIVLSLAACGADVIELGVPFSDPIADGPVIQQSSQRSLANGTTLDTVLQLASRIRARSDVPLILFTYFNPLYRFGIERFAARAASAGVDGVLVTDIVDGEARELSALLSRGGIDLISLVAPTTADDRLRLICENARGFVYAVARAGITGVRGEASADAETLVRRIRHCTDLPIAVGFGISAREHVEDVWRYADAAVIGSRIVTEIDEEKDPSALPQRVARLVSDLVPQRGANQ